MESTIVREIYRPKQTKKQTKQNKRRDQIKSTNIIIPEGCDIMDDVVLSSISREINLSTI